MSLPIREVFSALVTHGRATGKMTAVVIGEYMNPPPDGLVMAVFLRPFGVALTGHGLAATSGHIGLTIRLYHPALCKPISDREIKIAEGADALLRRLNADLDLGGLVRNLDILGEMGEVATWTPGYVTIDAKVSRIADLQLNMIVNDVWPQAVSG